MYHFPPKWLLLTWLLNSVVSTSERRPGFNSNRRLISHVPRVVQGIDDIHNRYPYVVCIMFEQLQGKIIIEAKQCSGTLITRQWVLTAAHCVAPIKLRVKCDNISIPWNESKCKANVLKTIPHPSFIMAGSIVTNDIALMLIEEIVMKRYGKLHAADYKSFIGRAVKYVGYGLTKPKVSGKDMIKEFLKPLKIGKGVVFNDDNKLDNIMLPRILVGLKCSNKENYSNKGDSGGPVFIDGRIAGVLSGGPPPYGLSMPGHPDPISAYCPVSPYITWIMEIVAS